MQRYLTTGCRGGDVTERRLGSRLAHERVVVRVFLKGLRYRQDACEIVVVAHDQGE